MSVIKLTLLSLISALSLPKPTASQASPSSVKYVHTVFMNHLDVGYNNPGGDQPGTSTNVVNNYFDNYFPLAVQIANEAIANGTSYIYTTHAYLLSLFFDCPPNMGLHCPTQNAMNDVSTAIDKGWIRWHAFPFNSEFELHNRYLFETGLKLPKQLSRQFNTPPSVCVSQRDVPGTTRSAIPILRRMNVSAMSIGCNGGSAPPAVPKIFIWQDPESSQELLTMVHGGGYGGDKLSDCVYLNNFEHALCWGFRGDNDGPGSFGYVYSTYEQIQSEFPNATVFPSTYTDFVTSVLADANVMANLPVITTEIGDTWVHGAQADPYKSAAGRVMQTEAERCLRNGGCSWDSRAFWNFSRQLLKFGEHTYGGDIKHFLDSSDPTGAYFQWTNAQFEAYLASNSSNNRMTTFRSTWFEQRDWIITYPMEALAMSNDSADIKLHQSIASELHKLRNPTIPDISNTSQWKLIQNVSGHVFQVHVPDGSGTWRVGFDPSTGAMIHLESSLTSINYANSHSPLGEYIYQSLTEDDFINFINDYSYTYPPPSWVTFDFGKHGLDEAFPMIHDNYVIGNLVNLWVSTSGNSFVTQLNLGVNSSDLRTNYGGCEFVWNEIVFEDMESVNMKVTMANKTATRVPEVNWFGFRPIKCVDWRVDKLGQLVDLKHLVMNGSFHLHGTTGNVTCAFNSGEGDGLDGLDELGALGAYTYDVALMSVDSALVGFVPAGASEFTPFPTPFVNANEGNGAAFILNDNIWGTNYPVWMPFDDNPSFSYRFKLFFQ